MKRLILSAALLFAFGSASASVFYLDPLQNFDGVLSPSGGKVCDTCTSVKDEFTFAYDSRTIIQDTDGSGTITAGDILTTDGGLAVGGLSTNLVTGFLPAQSFGTNNDNGYGGDNWLISFSIEGLQGVITGVENDIPLFAYGPGTIEMFITFDGSNFDNFMNIAVEGGGATGVSTVLTGTADFADIENLTYANLFNSATFDCNGSSGFYDIWNECGAGAGEALAINFFASFDTNVFVSDFDYDPDAGVFTLSSDHDGSATFTVPEPAVLALFGTGLMLLGLMGMRRRHSS